MQMNIYCDWQGFIYYNELLYYSMKFHFKEVIQNFKLD